MAGPELPPDHQNGEGSLYGGRWIARINGRIVSQGGTPEQARQAAKASRFKETPHITYMSTTPPISIHPILERIASLVPETLEVYVVGGAVRDALLGAPVRDLDFSLPKGAIKTARKVADSLGATFYPLDKDRDYGRVILPQPGGDRLVLDFAAFQGDSLEEDLKGRDFTINAIAVDLHRPQELLDPLGGAADLHAKRLRMCSPETFNSDPIRIIRAIRFALTLKILTDSDTRDRMRASVHLLPNVSPERLRDELFNLLDCRKPSAAIRALDYINAIPHVLPELSSLKGFDQPLPHIFNAWEHSLDVLKQMRKLLDVLQPAYDPDQSASLHFGLISGRLGRYRDQLESHFKDTLNQDRDLTPLLFLAGLYHDIGKPDTRQIDQDGRVRYIEHEVVGSKLIADRGHKLQLSNPEIERLRVVVLNHMRPLWLAQTGQLPSRRAIYRFFRDTGAAGVDICLLSLADTLATYGPTLPSELWTRQIDVIRNLLEAWWEDRNRAIYPPAVVDGHDLIDEFGLQPGPIVGRLLQSIREAQAVGSVNNRRQALELASDLLNDSNYQGAG
jgi:poly(A) polymerase